VKTLINNNVVVILRDVQEALKQGYRFVSGRSDLVEWPTGMLEIDLYKQEIEIPEINFEDELGIVYLADYDKIKFMIALQRYILNGYQVELDSVAYDIIGTKRCKLIRPDHPSLVLYSKEELESMDYEALKVIARIRQCFNKTRAILINNVLKFQQDMQ